MATHTLTTSGNLTALTFLRGYNSGMAGVDQATMQALIKNDATGGHLPFQPGGYIQSGGLLEIPRRGTLKMLPGDVIAIDSTTGWPILVSKLAIASGPWTFT